MAESHPKSGEEEATKDEATRRSNFWHLISTNADAHFTDLSNMDVNDQLLQVLDYIIVKWQIVDLSQNHIGPAGAWILGRHLPQMSITDLRLAYNYLGDEGVVRYLAPALSNTRIRRLDLEANNLSDLAAKAIADVLRQTSIRELYLSHNTIGDGGALALCPSINQLIVLDLFGNKLTDTGVSAIASVLPEGMVELYLGENIQVGDVSIARLASALADSRVKHVGLMRNSISDAGVCYLMQAAKRSELSEILLHGNPASPALVCELERILHLKDTAWFKLIVILCSTRAISRIGQRSALRMLPIDIVRRISITLYSEEA